MKPTVEEIAELSNQSCTRELNKKRAELWMARATMVEASTHGRCKSCRWWNSAPCSAK